MLWLRVVSVSSRCGIVGHLKSFRARGGPANDGQALSLLSDRVQYLHIPGVFSVHFAIVNKLVWVFTKNCGIRAYSIPMLKNRGGLEDVFGGNLCCLPI